MAMSVKELLENFQGEKEMRYGVDTAMASLRPGALYSLYNTELREYNDPQGRPPPTWNEIDAEYERQKKVSEHYSKYYYQRVDEYPKGYEQLDMLWHAIDQHGGDLKNSDWYKTIKKIKEKYPKPEGPAPE